ncbi:hypothetical protein [Floridanema aerugineum]|uniref:Uncharacterized protein n=1 Tax=Floridaenema aerugineum BLCC-F46 TaxID=3153654 RepID=A0ABV4XEI6_9CYAN
MERQKLYERFTTLDWQQQLGNLASTLATISQQSINPKQDSLTNHLLREAALMIEWSASNVPQEFLLELAGMQRELLAWRKDFPIESARNILSLYARNRADCLLQMSGWLEDDEKVELNSDLASVFSYSP